jgi:hypothetical protein
MTDNEIKVLKFLNKSRSQNNITSVIADSVELTEYDTKAALESLKGKRYIRKNSTKDQEALYLTAWKIEPDGEKKVNEVAKFDTLKHGQDKPDPKKEKANILSGLSNGGIWTAIVILCSGAYFLGDFFGANRKNKEDAIMEMKYKTLRDSILSTSIDLNNPNYKKEDRGTGNANNDTIGSSAEVKRGYTKK